MGGSATVIQEVSEHLKNFEKRVRIFANYEKKLICKTNNMEFNNLKPAKVEIKILGTGCARCKSLEEATRKAVDELKLDSIIEKVEDIQKIMGYGIMRTPGLVLNNKVILSGQVPNISELKELITKNL